MVDSLGLIVILSAFADPGQRALMTVLYCAEEPVDCAILAKNAVVDVSSPILSHHRVLREAGLGRVR